MGVWGDVVKEKKKNVQIHRASSVYMLSACPDDSVAFATAPALWMLSALRSTNSNQMIHNSTHLFRSNPRAQNIPSSPQGPLPSTLYARSRLLHLGNSTSQLWAARLHARVQGRKCPFPDMLVLIKHVLTSHLPRLITIVMENPVATCLCHIM